MTGLSELAGGKWGQPNGPSEINCPWCGRDPFSGADDADCTCVQWCGSPDCTCEAPDEDTAALIGAFEAAQAENVELRELLSSIWLYVSWPYVTKQLTTEQKELWADAVDAVVGPRMVSPGEVFRPVAVRWWRDDFVTDADA